MAERDLLEREGLTEAGVDLAVEHHLVEGVGVLVVREVRALETLLTHPEVAQIHGGVETTGAGANHHHAARVADENRRRYGVLARVIEDDARCAPLAEDIPDLAAERA